MTEDPLVMQLREADGTAPLPPARSADVVGQVFRRVRRRRVWRRVAVVGSAAAAVLLAASVAWHAALPGRGANRPLAGPPGASPVDAEAGWAEIRALTARADACRTVVDRMLAAEQRRSRAAALRQSAPAIEPADVLLREADRAAYLTILRAERLRGQEGESEAAVAVYQQVIELFPQTPWAEVARQRLALLRKDTGAMLWRSPDAIAVQRQS